MPEAATQEHAAPAAIASNEDAAAEMARSMSDLTELLNRPAVSDVLTAEEFDQLEREARLMASGKTTIPSHLRGNVADCAAIIRLARRIKCDANALALKTYFVNDKLALEAQLVIAIINTSNELATNLNFKWFGDWTKHWSGKDCDSREIGVKVWAKLTGEDEPREMELTMAEVGKTRNSPLWGHNPKQQIAYRAGAYWARLNAPNATLGIRGIDEVMDERPVRTADPALRGTKGVMSVSDIAAAAVSTDPIKATIANMEKVALEQGYKAAQAAWKGLSESVKKTIGEAQAARIAQMGKDSDEARRVGADPSTGEIKGTPSGKTASADEFVTAIKEASSSDSAAMTLDEARSVFGAGTEEMKKVTAAYVAKWPSKG